MLAIVAGILVARHLKDLSEYRPSPATEGVISNAIRVAEWIMQKIDAATDR